jgi:hypothetical protein
MAPSFLFCIPNLVSHRPICAEILYSTVPKQCRSRHFLIFFPILGIVQNSSYILSLRPGQGLILVYTLKCTPSTSFYLSQPKGTKILVVALRLTGNVACQFCPWQQPGATYSILQYYTRNNVSVDCQCCSSRASSLIHVRWIVNWQFQSGLRSPGWYILLPNTNVGWWLAGRVFLCSCVGAFTLQPVPCH